MIDSTTGNRGAATRERSTKGAWIHATCGMLAVGLAGLFASGAGGTVQLRLGYAELGATEQLAASLATGDRAASGSAAAKAPAAWAPAYAQAQPDELVTLSTEMQRVSAWVSRRYRVSGDALAPVLAEAESSARNAGLDPLLIVAMMAVESSFNPQAESRKGARGLMQVIPRWHMDKIGEDAGEDALFDPRFNVQVGTLVLAEGMQRYGSLQAALQYYNGARNDPEARYTKKVLAVREQLATVARTDRDA